MASRTLDERITDNIRRQDQLKAEEKVLKKRKAQEERKARTRMLIELGGIVESVLGRPVIEDDKVRLLSFLRKQEANGKYFTRAMNADAAPAENTGQ